MQQHGIRKKIACNPRGQCARRRQGVERNLNSVKHGVCGAIKRRGLITRIGKELISFLQRRLFQCSYRLRKDGLTPALKRVALCLIVTLEVSALHQARSEEVEFEATVAPLISARCIECHNDKEASGGLSLSSADRFLAGGDSGKVIDSSIWSESLLWEKIRSGEMPPPSRGVSQKLPDDELESLRLWLEQGATWPRDRSLQLYEKTTKSRAGRDWWALQPIVRPQVPMMTEGAADVATAMHPVDAFIEKRLSSEGMQMAPPADRVALIRRAYFDLWGLPPSHEDVAKFVADDRPDAWPELIDRLLASPHYGERWARYWLDVVRFAETCGYERDQLKPGIWRYRDWVINALNEDMPYDRFVIEQLAGDEIEGRTESSLIATGMLRAGTWNDEPNDAEDYKYERLEDLVDVTSTAFLGLTVKCARCHDHKFDPIPQTDYYRIASFFWAGYIGQQNLGGPTAEQLGADVFGWTDRGRSVEPIHLLIKGERAQPGEVVEPGFLTAVPQLDKPLSTPAVESRTTSRRLQYAMWITDPQNPLTARVAVNRIWQHHFGQALVRSPDNFGFKSSPPTHPELLDWLATEFINPSPSETSESNTSNGAWRMKRMHKLLMTSRTYQQSSLHPKSSEYEQRDFANESWWHFNRQRLDAESLRDAILCSSGSLNPAMGGESFYPSMSAEALEGLSKKSNDWKPSSPHEQNRRSIYMMTKRSRILPLMTAFDFCETNRPCAQRDVTTVPTQALAMLNNEFVHTQSRAMSARIIENVGDDLRRQIESAWRMTLGRSPLESEIQAALRHLGKQTENFAQANERVASQARAATFSDDTLPVDGTPALWLRADRGVEVDQDKGVMFWRETVAREGVLPIEAAQGNKNSRPCFVEKGSSGQAAISFDGKQQYLRLTDQILRSNQFSVLAVVNHQATDAIPREILSNWDRRERVGSSFFLGTLGENDVRLSDALNPAGALQHPGQTFVLTAVTEKNRSRTFQNQRILIDAGALAERDLRAAYVIGTQGNINGEYWHGEIYELIAFDRPFSDEELNAIWAYLSKRYDLEMKAAELASPSQLALASLCHVLLNTNEFLYVD
jgi:Protein of unknown function (DUF1549)/Protein of unknown function (DUF1553)/Planctomycete cytochrome C